MRRSYSKFLAVSAACFLTGCNGSHLSSEATTRVAGQKSPDIPTRPKYTNQDVSAPSSSPMPNPSPLPMPTDMNYPSTTTDSDEAVAPPQQVTGALLSCVEEVSPVLAEALVKCQLVDAIKLENLDPAGIFESFAWSSQSSAAVAVSSAESDGRRVVRFSVKGSRADINEYMRGPNFIFSGLYANGNRYESRVAPAPLPIRWVAGDHLTVPALAFTGDFTESATKHYICRMEINGRLHTGALDTNNVGKLPNCKVQGGRTDFSSLATGTTAARAYEVLVADAPDHLEWYVANGKTPAFAMMTGTDTYTCRSKSQFTGQNNTGTIAALAIGYVTAGSDRCTYETDGESINTYDVLGYKTGALMPTFGNIR